MPIERTMQFGCYFLFFLFCSAGQLLIKWLISTLQSDLPTLSLSMDELNSIVVHFCKNLVKLGILKQISGKGEATTPETVFGVSKFRIAPKH